jgi:hypothetical protein
MSRASTAMRLTFSPNHTPPPRNSRAFLNSPLDKFSMANVGPGASLLWVHLASAYVVTFIVLKVNWA